MKTGELQRWRFIYGGVRESLNARLRDADGNYNSDKLPELYEIAVDGLSLSEDALHLKPKAAIEFEPG
ncbi:hypothetical protein [Iningainema tapete]|uniref:Uncharacterized protein n=1 Tax=Iningainema tapete BLCC-T55 TaxID=2748662 RepID=A0A8J6XHZ4_9CYAN|nr:hypothetical protein [Iningainema tapete]MBD2773052.1 hypothetical protein [Iningainema tapete BLCC-T55]